MFKRKLSFFIILIIIVNICFYPIDVNAEGSAIDIAGNASAGDAGFIPADAPAINAQAAIVMDLDTGDILYEKNAHQQLYPASITKVMTCLLAVENGNVNDVITVSDSVMEQVEEGSSAIGLQSGEQLTLKDALYGMMLNSGNECALAIAEHIAGSTGAFSIMMNDRARELGCTDSNFVNPNGLQDQNHYTSCYDMALIGCAAYQYPEFKTLISSQAYTIPETNLNEERPLWQENRLIYSGNKDYYYQYCTGGKTGYTETALATLISFAERDGRRLVTVVMRCNPTTESYSDTIKLDEFCFTKYHLCKPLIDYSFSSMNIDNSIILANYYDDLNHELPKYYVNQSYSFYVRSFINDADIEKNIDVYKVPENGVAGKISFSYQGQALGETDITMTVPVVMASSTDAIVAEKNTPKPEPQIVKIAKRVIVLLSILIVLLLIVIIVAKIRKKIQYYNSKRRVRYFPRSRDPRLKENKERLERERLEKEKLEKEKQEQELKQQEETVEEEGNVEE